MSRYRILDDEFLRDIARQYAEHVAAERRPAPAIAATEQASVSTVHRWAVEARKRGFLAPTTPGLASGHASPTGSQGEVGERVRRNVQLLRKARRMTYVELSAVLHGLGRPIPVLGLRRIEAGTRRVDVDDLAVLAEVFGAPPAALLEPLPECSTCHGAPPPGFSCTECDAATSKETSA